MVSRIGNVAGKADRAIDEQIGDLGKDNLVPVQLVRIFQDLRL